MSRMREVSAILVVVIALLTSVAGSPQPEETKNEIDNPTPKKSEAIAQKTVSQTVTSSSPTDKVHITRAPPIPTPSSGFSKFINDIFQIPISVLKAVSNFLSNSFGNGQLQRKS
ncbi:uncharacterized protein LOC110829572 isoform X2 [Zootermopsis nevadensis]|uniref:Uncharacterized protein n=2 Tax=Zootermopsis nevadensis TaxID=136037 RepID=A0A067R8F0_ZOONE|nr:uncharacterized protein LOC110829572 isoform X2 [Zootermopsis nevadensis]XP_021919114.1 uncharacterized protein LOC110829572 isoform X2 [Zootermopsis nevadensis]XP_021919115.1 uncharacterized protein LOC110829572 isoform X2 [Zootermopsis nevadensis]KDR19841.1 hypothetical protein L798_05907 [Zootermopsis nevadensis]